MLLTLTFRDNQTLHGDIVFEFAGKTAVCDSYYLAIDSNPRADESSASKVREILYLLLEQWLTAAQTLKPGMTIYLPFDFSDQYTAWLRCTNATDDLIDIQLGWSRVEGYSFYPSDISEHLYGLPDFTPVGTAIRTDAPQLIVAIRHSMTLAQIAP